MSELRKFGATVVSADHSRVVLATNKRTQEEAVVRAPAVSCCRHFDCDFSSHLLFSQTYVEYISATLASQPLFQYLQLVPRRYWQQLLFLDHCNYGGVLFSEVNPIVHLVCA